MVLLADGCLAICGEQARSHTPAQKSSARSTAPAKAKVVPRCEYVGDRACAGCHEDRFNSYEKTAHNLTSQLSNKDTVLGTFAPGLNTMATANPDLTFRTDQKGDNFSRPPCGPPRTAARHAPAPSASIWSSAPAAAPSPAHAKLDSASAPNCIGCHMPKLGSKVVYLDIDGQRIRPKFRSHWIKVYSQKELQ